ncbi:DNA-binding transcriptional ArsR family regulator [Kribbella aluminosa]|uniref:DNA-binding transcriptional ArsR family regulator n=1 Tax=Kribbella aluminosa TaxID=416017 RepID=A0ABS4UF74_9ACTN|nr:metalloregulator ArsR/SmtB family transcription factor [Kribbella aluminosa]MBP2350303.1 DNA-binding transcriptional ArsR family regulator [Kribbella aluminosa]
MLTTTFGALADPTRLAIVGRLSRGEATMGELAEPHRITPPAMTKHVRVLVDAGLVRRRRVGRTVVCTLRPEAISEVESWLGDLTSYWNSTVDRLEELLREDDDGH